MTTMRATITYLRRRVAGQVYPADVLSEVALPRSLSLDAMLRDVRLELASNHHAVEVVETRISITDGDDQ